MMVDECRVCGVELNDDNWYPSQRKIGSCICKEHHYEHICAWRIENPEKGREYAKRYQKNDPEKARMSTEASRRRKGIRPFNKNKECAMYLGVHVTERLLQRVFNDVEMMPIHNPGFDFICSNGKLIDVKSACIGKDKNWNFHIRRNIIPDFFLCLAFDNREDLGILHAWLLPGYKFNHLTGTSVSMSTVSKWDEYSIDMTKILACCEIMKGDNNV